MGCYCKWTNKKCLCEGIGGLTIGDQFQDMGFPPGEFGQILCFLRDRTRQRGIGLCCIAVTRDGNALLPKNMEVGF